MFNCGERGAPAQQRGEEHHSRAGSGEAAGRRESRRPADFWRASIAMGVRAPYFRAAGADFTAAPRPFGAPIFAISDSARFVSADLGFEYATPVQPGAGPALWVRRVDGEGVRLVGDADFASFEAGFGTRSPILARRDLARRVSAETGPLDFEGVRMDTFS